MEFVLLIGLPALLAIGFLVWYLRSDRGVVSPTETPIRRRESARDWQRRLAAGPSLEGHFLQPTQNEILETLYVLDYLTPGWETDPADVTERNFLNELALSFPSLRKPGGEYPLPFAERLAIKSAGTKRSGASVASEEEVSAIREKYQVARAHANALEQIASGTPRPATVVSGSLPFRLTTEAAPIPGGHNPWLARLAGAVILGAAVVESCSSCQSMRPLKPSCRRLPPAAEPAPVTLPPAAAEASPLPAPASMVAEPAPAASPAAVAVVAAVSPTPGEVPTPPRSPRTLRGPRSCCGSQPRNNARSTNTRPWRWKDRKLISGSCFVTRHSFSRKSPGCSIPIGRKNWSRNVRPPRKARSSTPLLRRSTDRNGKSGLRGPDAAKVRCRRTESALWRLMTSAGSTLLAAPPAALAAIRADEMLGHIEVLSSDDFGGRAPGSVGEERSVHYLTEQFQALGLEPGNPDGTYVQDVPLAGIRTTPTLSLDLGAGPSPLRYPQDFVAATARLVPGSEVKGSEIVFVGYGIVAPEYGWDDYKDVDVRGKTILMLINDPVLPDPADPARVDETMFRGRAMTYYGRWTYKYQIAASKGAAAAIIIHETGPAGYPYSVVETSWQREIYEVEAPDRNLGAVGVRSWITLEVAKRLLANAGQDFDHLKAAAQDRSFRPVALGSTATFKIENQLRCFKSRNVLARIEGSDPERRGQCIIYSAHWDHLGQGTDAAGDARIFRGAIDNASGVAALLGIARAFRTLVPAPKCSVLFLAPTAEESGLLGAHYYAANPLYPLADTLANINIDGMNPWGETRDIENICAGNSTLDDLLVELAAVQGRVVAPPSHPEKGYLYRADHFEFFKEGVPCLYPNGGKDVLGQPPGFGQLKSQEYTEHHYHQPSDQIDPAWNLDGAVQDTRLLFEVGYQIAVGNHLPEWKPSGEFRAKRDAMLRAR